MLKLLPTMPYEHKRSANGSDVSLLVFVPHRFKDSAFPAWWPSAPLGLSSFGFGQPGLISGKTCKDWYDVGEYVGSRVDRAMLSLDVWDHSDSSRKSNHYSQLMSW